MHAQINNLSHQHVRGEDLNDEERDDADGARHPTQPALMGGAAQREGERAWGGRGRRSAAWLMCAYHLLKRS